MQNNSTKFKITTSITLNFLQANNDLIFTYDYMFCS